MRNIAQLMCLVTLLSASIASLSANTEIPSPDQPQSRVTVPPSSLQLPSFYTKYIDADGLPVVSSEQVPDQALVAAAELARHMLANRPDLRAALITNGVRIAVMSQREVTTDLPENRTLTPKAYWDGRARGLGATPERPISSCAEENLLGYATDRYRGESVFIHEFAHTIHLMGLNLIDRHFDGRLRRLYQRAMEQGLWKQTYAATNYEEYWAEGVQSWFDANLEADPPNGIHNAVNTRTELEQYDPDLAALIAEVFRHTPWRWTKPSTQPTS